LQHYVNSYYTLHMYMSVPANYDTIFTITRCR